MPSRDSTDYEGVRRPVIQQVDLMVQFHPLGCQDPHRGVYHGVVVSSIRPPNMILPMGMIAARSWARGELILVEAKAPTSNNNNLSI